MGQPVKKVVTELNDVDHVEVDDVEYLGHLVVGHRGEERAVVVEGDVLDVPEVRPKVLHELERTRRDLFPENYTQFQLDFFQRLF